MRYHSTPGWFTIALLNSVLRSFRPCLIEYRDSGAAWYGRRRTEDGSAHIMLNSKWA